jgi:hypothetical protein
MMHMHDFRRHVEALSYYRKGLELIRDSFGGDQANLPQWRDILQDYHISLTGDMTCHLGRDLTSAMQRLDLVKTGAICDACGISASETVKLMRCARCNEVWYCSKECQTVDWKATHKKNCLNGSGSS